MIDSLLAGFIGGMLSYGIFHYVPMFFNKSKPKNKNILQKHINLKIIRHYYAD